MTEPQHISVSMARLRLELERQRIYAKSPAEGQNLDKNLDLLARRGLIPAEFRKDVA